VRIALVAAGGKNVEVLSPTIGGQLLERGLLDEIDCTSRLCCSVRASGCWTCPVAGRTTSTGSAPAIPPPN
jgi:hypothetical protein